MRRIASICLVSLLAVLLLASMFEASAQNIKVYRIGRALNELVPWGTTAPAWNQATGLRAVGVKSRSYFKADTVGTNAGVVGTPTWTIVSKPAGSTVTALDSADGKWINSFRPDTVGEYVIKATIGAKSWNDTIFASTYVGVESDANAGCTCHSFMTPGFADLVTGWKNSVHATIFKRGMTGNLETEHGKGAYTATCAKCHTTGWDNTINNNNFGWQVKATGWDTTWYKGLEVYAGDYWIPTGDTTRYMTLSAAQMKLGNIGCEQCHGPAAAHKVGPSKANIGLMKYTPDVCNQCHNSSRSHRMGYMFALSGHGQVNYGGASEGGRATCQPCHTGAGMLYYLNNNKDTTNIYKIWNAATMAKTPISCQICHDPHGANNPGLLRTMNVKGDTLKDGGMVPAEFRSSTGAICFICHGGRYSPKYRITTVAPYYGWTDRFYPHYNNQAEMLFGQGAYMYNDSTFYQNMTHGGVEGGCVGCHMQMQTVRGNSTPRMNHTFSMTDTTLTTGVWKATAACITCHGEIEDFNDIRAAYDYDRNGKIEGVQTEVAGLLLKLKATLPIDSVTGEPSTMRYDSLKVKNKPDKIQGIWNYYFVKNDGSYGVHNTKYAVRLLYKALGWTPLSVSSLGGVPTQFALEQNYPNPFNPTTTIRFSLPSEQHVKLYVYDINGALVKTLVDQAIGAGTMQTTWDGTNNAGSKVASGMYLYRLTAGSFTQVNKMLLMK